MLDRSYLARGMPTMLMWGGRDSVLPVGHAHRAHAAMPGSRLEIFPTTGTSRSAPTRRGSSGCSRTSSPRTEPASWSVDEWRELLRVGRPAPAPRTTRSASPHELRRRASAARPDSATSPAARRGAGQQPSGQSMPHSPRVPSACGSAPSSCSCDQLADRGRRSRVRAGGRRARERHAQPGRGLARPRCRGPTAPRRGRTRTRSGRPPRPHALRGQRLRWSLMSGSSHGTCGGPERDCQTRSNSAPGPRTSAVTSRAVSRCCARTARRAPARTTSFIASGIECAVNTSRASSRSVCGQRRRARRARRRRSPR